MRVLTVVGARPQFVKAAVVTRSLAEHGVEERLVHTGQHYDEGMSGRFFTELGIPEPWRNLGVGSGSHGAQTGRMLEGLEQAVMDARPDRVLVYGDTNSTLAGALAAVKLHVPVDHVEAGLRSYDRDMPEEVNRLVTDAVSDLLLCPTSAAVDSLAREGRDASTGVRRVGDVMYDAVLAFRDRAALPPEAEALAGRPFAVATCHRAENTDDPLRLAGILRGLQAVARDLPVLLPAHPRTRAALAAANLAAPAGVTLVDPVSYLQMVALLGRASLVLTDSGGLQKEAFFAGVPCITLRDRTEWTELVEGGWNVLAGTDPARIAAGAAHLADRAALPPRPVDLYGDGRAAHRIVGHLLAAGGSFVGRPLARP
jgi:UDP-GlcNAc3NAcA epimerase